MTEYVFGYRHIKWPGFRDCPCKDPGNFAAFEVRDGVDTILCWCGRTAEPKWETPAERQEFIDAHLRVDERAARRPEGET